MWGSVCALQLSAKDTSPEAWMFYNFCIHHSPCIIRNTNKSIFVISKTLTPRAHHVKRTSFHILANLLISCLLAILSKINAAIYQVSALVWIFLTLFDRFQITRSIFAKLWSATFYVRTSALALSVRSNISFTGYVCPGIAFAFVAIIGAPLPSRHATNLVLSTGSVSI